jgi:Flp pilus assembly pilin Flp
VVRKLLKDNRGVAAIEFALIIPLLAVLLVGLWDLSSYAYEKMRLEQMTRAVASNVVTNFEYSTFEVTTDRIMDEFYVGETNSVTELSVTSECR